MNEIEVILLKGARDFVKGLDKKAAGKIVSVMNQVKQGSRDSRLFKKLEGTQIWEFRAEYEGNAYRLMSFWDKEEQSLVVATHGFSKKAQKTPKKEIMKAERIREEYYKEKRK